MCFSIQPAFHPGLAVDAEKARQIETSVLRRLADHGGAHLAAATGLSESTISRLRNEHLGAFAKLLAAAGMKVVGQEMRCYQPEIVQAWRTLARAGIDHINDEAEG